MDDCKKTGILGGTFNPVHNGHLMIAENAYKEFDLSEVWMMPAYIPPHKRHEFILDDEFRLAMVAKAVEDVPYLKVSDYEIQRGNVSYTANTLTELKSLYPENEYFFIMGADSLMDFETWYHPEIILQKANLIVAARDDVDQKRLKERAAYLMEKMGGHIYILSVPKMDISSTMLRERVKNHQSIRAFVPDRVAEYICEMNLY